MITPDDIGACVFNRVANTTGFAATLPGSVWSFDRGPDVANGTVYAVFSVKPQSPQWLSGSNYVQSFTVSIVGYCPMGNATITPQQVEQFFNSSLAWQQDNMTLRGQGNGESVLHSKPLDGNASFDARLKQGKNVFTPGQTFELLCQGNRSVS